MILSLERAGWSRLGGENTSLQSNLLRTFKALTSFDPVISCLENLYYGNS